MHKLSISGFIILSVSSLLLIAWASPGDDGEVMVVDFLSIGTDETLGKVLSEILRGELAAQGVKVYDAVRTQQILAELGPTGGIGSSEVDRIIGKTGAGLVIYGSVSKVSGNYVLNVRFARPSTAVGGALTRIGREEDLVQLVKRLASEVDRRDVNVYVSRETIKTTKRVIRDNVVWVVVTEVGGVKVGDGVEKISQTYGRPPEVMGDEWRYKDVIFKIQGGVIYQIWKREQ
ncbi:MAG: FlgO family outer membrane protein [bacterium]